MEPEGSSLPIQVAERSKASFYGQLLAGIAGLNPAGCMDVLSVECCQVEVSAMDRSLVRWSPTKCGVLLYVSCSARKRRISRRFITELTSARQLS
jgi:hypothetical protein